MITRSGVLGAVLLVLTLVATPGLASADETRDIYARPFSWDSIWNLPLATTAVYGDFDAQVGHLYPDVENITLDPTAPVRELGGAGSGEVHVDPELQADGSWNNCSTLLVASPDQQTIIQGQPMVLEPGGDPSWRVGWDPQPLTGRGIEGCHGGSGLSGLGGTIREGELSGDAPLRHALKVSLPCTTSCSPENGGFRWPAVAADSGYEGKYGGENPQVNMGALLALPADADLSGITAPDVRKVAEALQTYGAYVVDETGGAPSGSFQVQSTAVREFPNIDSPQMRAVFNQLSVIENSAEDTPGGGALDAPRRAACAPPFADGTGGAPASCGAAHVG
ncbi:hypothetical protein EV188_112120 [Actinomycetospora succinea]|uniref:PASTA domain-containing protein n=1 Tax=Actinomycetospora succinea TaxID=663603 RepID=A0A4R6ULE6_9PSEU|nr:hypothetical protein [Actinomycetospora succinea]TDQ47850.1 hypothetical protein EV188_112120 [Actinomycetospora succinea]